MKPCFLLILLVLAVMNAGRSLLTALVASKGNHTKDLLQILQISLMVVFSVCPAHLPLTVHGAEKHWDLQQVSN